MNTSTSARGAPRDARRIAVRVWTIVGGARGLLVGALPFVLEAVSPNRLAVSFVLAAFYLAAALILVKPKTIDRPVLIFAMVAAAFIGLSLFRMETIDPLNAVQRAYGLSKAIYFIEVLIPLAVAVALLVSSLSDLKPAVVTYMVVGLTLALATVALRNSALLGAERYATQGNLIVVGGLLVSQFWIMRDFRIGAVLVLLCLVAVAITQSRQSVAAAVIGLGFTGVYWFVAERLREARGGIGSPLAPRWVLPAAGYGLVLGTVVVWAILILQPDWVPLPRWVRDPVTCNCIAGRFVDLTIHPGGRNVLIEQGWALFANHPIFGAGLGAFVGLAPYPYPHNLLLEVGGEMGIIGVLVLLAPLVAGWGRLALAGIKAASPAVASTVIILVVYGVVASLSGDLASQRAWWVFGLVILKLGWRRNPAEVET